MSQGLFGASSQGFSQNKHDESAEQRRRVGSGNDSAPLWGINTALHTALLLKMTAASLGTSLVSLLQC